MTIEEEILELSVNFRYQFQQRVDERFEEMKSDDNSHFLIYDILRIPESEKELIDLYQNKGRFLYRHAGSFVEQAAKLCFSRIFPSSQSIRIENKIGVRPRMFEIDCLEGQNAIEIKWRDATTDGDHVTKEQTKVQVIANAGYIPIQVMFYHPNRKNAIRVQKILRSLYEKVGGEYYSGDEAWEYIFRRTSINLKIILERIAKDSRD